MNKPTALEISLFRFVTVNNLRFRGITKLIRFKFSDLVTLNLKKTATMEKTRTKEQLKKNIDVGIITGQISVMRLDLNSKTKFKHIRRILL